MILVEATVDSPASRQRLLGVCSEWRDILISVPTLWTTIPIYMRDPTDRQLRMTLDCLSDRLSRCESHLLDVVWDVDGLSESAAESLFALLSRQAPFTHWRSLELWDWSSPRLQTTNMGDFRNLEQLVIRRYAPGRFLKAIHESKTSKLRKLVILEVIASEWIRTEVLDLIRQVYRLELTELPLSIKLPTNVKELKTSYLPLVTFTHLKLLHFITRFHPLVFSDLSFPNLVSLTITFEDRPPCFRGAVNFFALESLTLDGSVFDSLAFISAPRLRKLAIRASVHFAPYTSQTTSLVRVLSATDFLLSPSEELDLGFPVDSKTLTLALAKMRHAETIQINMSCLKEEWRGIVAAITTVNFDLIKADSSLNTKWLVLNPDSGLDELDTGSRRKLEKDISESLGQTGINVIKITSPSGHGIEMHLEDISGLQQR